MALLLQLLFMVTIMPHYNDYLAYIYETLQPFAERSGQSNQVLSEKSELVAELGLSSIDVMEVIVDIEDHFDLSIPLNILPDITTIGDLAKALEKLRVGCDKSHSF